MGNLQKECYLRSLLMLFLCSYHKVNSKADIVVEHTLSNGLYCTVQKEYFVDVATIKDTMCTLQKHAIPFETKTVSIEDAISYFTSQRMYEKVAILKQQAIQEVKIQVLQDYQDILYGELVEHTGMIPSFSLLPYEEGYWLSFETQQQMQPKVFSAFKISQGWGQMLHVSTIAQLNTIVQNKKFHELVVLYEMIQEQQFSSISKRIMKQSSIRCILLAGPSCSGKTSSSYRLQMHLKLYGKEVVCLSMDDFYKNREDTAKLADGSYDFDSIHAIDLELFYYTIQKLLHKEQVYLPIYNFKTGKREWSQHPIQLKDTQLLMIEGIHALHPSTSKHLPKDTVYKLYMNALTHVNIDEHTRMKTSDYRLIRRIARDNLIRNWNAQETLKLWENVRNKEDEHIYPYQEEADDVMNTAMAYELSILKPIVQPQLECIKKQDPTYEKAQDLLRVLTLVYEAEADVVPQYSVFAEFIGKSLFPVT